MSQPEKTKHSRAAKIALVGNLSFRRCVRRFTIICLWLMIGAIVLIAPATAFMNGLPHPKPSQNQVVFKFQGDYEPLATKQVQGETPETLGGIWLDYPIFRVRITVDEQGNVTETQPLLGHSLLLEAALTAARQWKFPPAQENGRPVRVSSAVNIQFQTFNEGRKRGLLEAATQQLKNPSVPRVALYNVGFAYAGERKCVEAIEYFQKAIATAPDWAVVYATLGMVFYELDEYEKAVGCFQQAIKLKPDFFEPHLWAGWCYRRLNREAKMLYAFEQAAAAAKSVDNQVAAYRNLVSSYESLDQKKAAADAQMQVAMNSGLSYTVVKSSYNTPGEAFWAGTKYEHVGQAEKAVKAYRFAMEIDPLSEHGLLCRLILADHLRKNKKTEEEAQLLTEMVEMMTQAISTFESTKNTYGLGKAYFWRGRARQEQGRFQAALKDLKKSVECDPDWKLPHWALGYVYLALGNRKKAVSEYQTSGMKDESFLQQLLNQSR